MSVLQENVIIQENEEDSISDTEIKIQSNMVCRICGYDCDSEIKGPLKKYCKCDLGYYHTRCFKKCILDKKSLQCDICYQYFLNVDMTTKTRIVNGREYIICTLLLNLIFIFVIWLFYYSSINDKCEIDPTDQYYIEKCVNYQETLDAFYIANIFITIMISLIACILCLYFRETGLIELEYFHVILVE